MKSHIETYVDLNRADALLNIAITALNEARIVDHSSQSGDISEIYRATIKVREKNAGRIQELNRKVVRVETLPNTIEYGNTE